MFMRPSPSKHCHVVVAEQNSHYGGEKTGEARVPPDMAGRAHGECHLVVTGEQRPEAVWD